MALVREFGPGDCFLIETPEGDRLRVCLQRTRDKRATLVLDAPASIKARHEAAPDLSGDRPPDVRHQRPRE
jgi:hypothetical protein